MIKFFIFFVFFYLIFNIEGKAIIISDLVDVRDYKSFASTSFLKKSFVQIQCGWCTGKKRIINEKGV